MPGIGIAVALAADAAIGGDIATKDLGFGPDVPGAPPAPPTRKDPRLEAARKRQRDLLRRRRGRSSTILTGAGGILDPLGQEGPRAGSELLG